MVTTLPKPQMTNVKTCKCQGCAGLRQRYQKDPTLLQFYAKKLLQRGWAGKTDDVEKSYMESHADWYQAAQERGREVAAMNFGVSQGMPQDGPKRRTESASRIKADLERKPCYNDGCPVALNWGSAVRKRAGSGGH